MTRVRSIISIALLVAACTGPAAAQDRPGHSALPAQERQLPFIPVGASIGPDGYATITDAPPAPFTPVEPVSSKPPTAEQIAAREDYERVRRFQGEVIGRAATVANHLRVAEKGNFTDFYYDNDGETVVFQFLRDGPATLGKYIRDPRFVGRTVRFSEQELQAAMEFMLETFREDRVIIGGHTGTKRNRAVVDIAITEPEFRALVARKGVTIPEAVELEFKATVPASILNRPLPASIAPLVRIFPRYYRPLGPLNEITREAKVELRDGCFRVAGGSHDDALVLFPLGAQLFVDRAGYLAYGEKEVPGYARVGEELVFPGSIDEVTADELVSPIRRACGAGKVIRLTATRSAAAEGAQNIVAQNAETLRELREMYGLPERDARRALEDCKKKMGGPICITSPPPPMMPSQCPAGTTPTNGSCLTPEGYLRPLPEWLQPYETL